MPTDPFYWFTGDSYAAIRAQMDAAPGGRLEVRLADEHMTLTVVPSGASANAAVNDSHRCPPSCP